MTPRRASKQHEPKQKQPPKPPQTLLLSQVATEVSSVDGQVRVHIAHEEAAIRLASPSRGRKKSDPTPIPSSFSLKPLVRF